MAGSERSALERLRHAGRLARKELREILRDRRTIVTLVLMPILVYPLIGMTLQKFLAAQLTQQPVVEYRIGYRTLAAAQANSRLWRLSDAFRARAEGRPVESPREPKGTEDDPKLVQFAPKTPEETYDLDALLTERVIDVGITAEANGDGTTRLELVQDESSSLSRAAGKFLEQKFRSVNEEFLAARLKEVDPQSRIPVTVTRRTIPATGTTAFSLATLVPLILILMTVTGAVYPAIDLTAGERERGTLEALISAPVRRHELLLAKYCAVLVVALLTAVANLVAMTATAYITGLESLLFGKGGLTWTLILHVFGVLAVFAGFFSSMLLAVTSFARSFKEAQAYLIPVMLVSIAPGILALMPGLRMTVGMSLVPLANMVLLTRDLFEGQLETVPAVAALISTVIYTAVGLVLAAQIFGTDAVLYGSSGSWSDLWRRPLEARTSPTLTQVFGCLAVVLPAFLILGRLLARWVETSMSVWVVGQLALTASLFVGLPALWSWWHRIPLAAAFQWRSTPALGWICAALAGLSLWPFAYESLVFALPSEQLQELAEKFSGVEARLAAIPFPLRLLVFAVMPAVTEELFFRGYLLQGLVRGWGRWPAILLGGAIFGLFHVFTQGLSFERFLPSTILGVCLGWVCLRTGSVGPGMLLHVLHNGLLLALSEYSDELKSAGIGVQEQSHLPAAWLIVAGGMVVASWFGLLRVRPARTLTYTTQ